MIWEFVSDSISDRISDLQSWSQWLRPAAAVGGSGQYWSVYARPVVNSMSALTVSGCKEFDSGGYQVTAGQCPVQRPECAGRRARDLQGLILDRIT